MITGKNTAASNRLKTQRPFICNAGELRRKYDLTWKEIELLMPPNLSFWIRRTPSILCPLDR
jgi:hypothetical protein